MNINSFQEQKDDFFINLMEVFNKGNKRPFTMTFKAGKIIRNREHPQES